MRTFLRQLSACIVAWGVVCTSVSAQAPTTVLSLLDAYAAGRAEQVVAELRQVENFDRIRTPTGANLLQPRSPLKLRAPGRRQLIVVFTDGIDSNSTTSIPVLNEVASRTTATLTMVMPATAAIVQQQFSDVSMVPTLTRTILASPRLARVNAAYVALTANTGGTVVPFRANEDLGSLFKRVLESFRSTYVLHFIPTGVDAGGFHELRVTVKRPNTTATARRGYFGG